MKRLLLFYLLLCSISIIAQEKAIGSWTDHLSYSRGTSIDTDGDNVYCGTESGLFIYNTSDNSIQRRNKINGLTGVNIQMLAYNKYNSILLIIYNNGGIDLINKKNGEVNSIPFLKNTTAYNNKNINHIYFNNEMAYLSFPFGIIEINTNKNEINETYQFGSNSGSINVNSALTIGDKLVAATNEGIYYGNFNDNLLDFSNWNKVNRFNNDVIKSTFKLANKAHVVVQNINNIDSIYEFNENLQFIKVEAFSGKKLNQIKVSQNEITLLDEDDLIEIFDSSLTKIDSFPVYTNGLVNISFTKKYFYLINTSTPLIEYKRIDGSQSNSIKPLGPNKNDVFDITVSNGVMWTINGAYDFALNNAFKYINLNLYENGSWKNFNNFNTSSLNGVYDPISVETHPDDPKNVFISTWGSGLFEMKESLPFDRYDENNSTLEPRLAFGNWRGVSDVVFDKEGNLWGVNTHVPSAIFTRTVNNNWHSFEMTGSQQITHEDRLTEIVITPGGLKWVAMPLSNNILVFDDNGTIQNKNDDRHLILTQENGNGSLPGSRGITMEVDKSGQLWVGTSEGVVVHYNPDNVFDREFRDFEEVIINDGNNNEVVLRGAVINDIEVDGANRKWIATEGSGVFLFSSDLKKQVLHFTVDNSPIISNNVKTIAFDETTGEVYFGTSLGIVSYKSEVIAGSENFNEVVIYPNPVRANYNGPIAIKGLMDKTTVKITDINGTLVNEVISEGGQILWYGTNFNGEKVSSGVYLIFNSAEDELGNLNTKIGKVLFLK
jgi:hypothetical protein